MIVQFHPVPFSENKEAPNVQQAYVFFQVVGCSTANIDSSSDDRERSNG